MKVAIDYRPALHRPTGVGLYVHYLVRTALAQAPQLEWYLFSSSWSDRFPAHAFAGTAARVVDRRWPVRVLNYLWPRLHWPTIESLIGQAVDIAHSPTPLLMPARRARQVITVHDLWFLRPDAGTWREIARDYPRYFSRACRQADLVFVVSETTARALWDHEPVTRAKTVVTHLGTPPEFLAPLDAAHAQQVWARYRLPEAYLLFVGALIPRKNPDLLVATYRLVRARFPDLPLVVVGTGPERAVLDRARRAGLPILHLAYIDRAHLPAVYARARCLLLVSHDEGFGLPLLEAMAAGVPVVALARGAVPEVLDDAGLLVAEADPEAVAAAVQQVLEHEALARDLVRRGRQRARRFDWRETVAKTLEGYRQVLLQGRC